MINASIDMLNHLGHTEHAKVIYDATYQTIVNDAIRTPGILFEFIKFFGITIFIYFPFLSYSPDLGGNHTSTDVVENILKVLSTKRVNW